MVEYFDDNHSPQTVAAIVNIIFALFCAVFLAYQWRWKGRRMPFLFCAVVLQFLVYAMYLGFHDEEFYLLVARGGDLDADNLLEAIRVANAGGEPIGKSKRVSVWRYGFWFVFLPLILLELLMLDVDFRARRKAHESMVRLSGDIHEEVDAAEKLQLEDAVENAVDEALDRATIPSGDHGASQRIATVQLPSSAAAATGKKAIVKLEGERADGSPRRMRHPLMAQVKDSDVNESQMVVRTDAEDLAGVVLFAWSSLDGFRKLQLKQRPYLLLFPFSSLQLLILTRFATAVYREERAATIPIFFVAVFVLLFFALHRLADISTEMKNLSVRGWRHGVGVGGLLCVAWVFHLVSWMVGREVEGVVDHPPTEMMNMIFDVIIAQAVGLWLFFFRWMCVGPGMDKQERTLTADLEVQIRELFEVMLYGSGQIPARANVIVTQYNGSDDDHRRGLERHSSGGRHSISWYSQAGYAPYAQSGQRGSAWEWDRYYFNRRKFEDEREAYMKRQAGREGGSFYRIPVRRGSVSRLVARGSTSEDGAKKLLTRGSEARLVRQGFSAEPKPASQMRAHTFVQPPKSKRSLRFGGVDERLVPVYGQGHRRVETQSSEAGGSSEFEDDVAVVVDTDNPDLMEKQLHYSPQGALLAKGKQQGPGRGRRAADGGQRGLTSSGSMGTSSQSGSPRGSRSGRGRAGSRGTGDSFLGRPPRKDTRGGQSGRVGGEGVEGAAPRRGRSALRSRASGSEADDRRVAIADGPSDNRRARSQDPGDRAGRLLADHPGSRGSQAALLVHGATSDSNPGWTATDSTAHRQRKPWQPGDKNLRASPMFGTRVGGGAGGREDELVVPPADKSFRNSQMERSKSRSWSPTGHLRPEGEGHEGESQAGRSDRSSPPALVVLQPVANGSHKDSGTRSASRPGSRTSANSPDPADRWGGSSAPHADRSQATARDGSGLGANGRSTSNGGRAHPAVQMLAGGSSPDSDDDATSELDDSRGAGRGKGRERRGPWGRARRAPGSMGPAADRTRSESAFRLRGAAPVSGQVTYLGGDSADSGDDAPNRGRPIRRRSMSPSTTRRRKPAADQPPARKKPSGVFHDPIKIRLPSGPDWHIRLYEDAKKRSRRQIKRETRAAELTKSMADITQHLDPAAEARKEPTGFNLSSALAADRASDSSENEALSLSDESDSLSEGDSDVGELFEVGDSGDGVKV